MRVTDVATLQRPSTWHIGMTVVSTSTVISEVSSFIVCSALAAHRLMVLTNVALVPLRIPILGLS